MYRVYEINDDDDEFRVTIFAGSKVHRYCAPSVAVSDTWKINYQVSLLNNVVTRAGFAAVPLLFAWDSQVVNTHFFID